MWRVGRRPPPPPPPPHTSKGRSFILSIKAHYSTMIKAAALRVARSCWRNWNLDFRLLAVHRPGPVSRRRHGGGLVYLLESSIRSLSSLRQKNLDPSATVIKRRERNYRSKSICLIRAERFATLTPCMLMWCHIHPTSGSLLVTEVEFSCSLSSN